MPVLATSGSAAYDLCTIDGPTDLAPLTVKKFDTGLRLAYLPEDSFILLASRSGLALRHSCFVQAGVIDSDYRGPICCLLYNGSADSVAHFERGDKICQALILPRLSLPGAGPPLRKRRGEGGFGSSGVKSANDGLDICVADPAGPTSCPTGGNAPTETSGQRRETEDVPDQKHQKLSTAQDTPSRLAPVDIREGRL